MYIVIKWNFKHQVPPKSTARHLRWTEIQKHACAIKRLLLFYALQHSCQTPRKQIQKASNLAQTKKYPLESSLVQNAIGLVNGRR